MKLHFGDEQFEVDAAQLSIAFTQVTLWRGVKRQTKSEPDQGEKVTPLTAATPPPPTHIHDKKKKKI